MTDEPWWEFRGSASKLEIRRILEFVDELSLHGTWYRAVGWEELYILEDDISEDRSFFSRNRR